MESIDRLREYAGRLSNNRDPWCRTARDLSSIADAIEREAKANRVDAYTKGYDEGFASADDWAAQHEDAMAEHGWVRLPVDADGEVIHGGDMMVKPDSYDNRLFTVGGMTLYGDQWSVQGFAPIMLRHHAPTVEDVLREVVTLCHNTWKEGSAFHFYDVDDVMESGNIAEYAAKLRLAGDE